VDSITIKRSGGTGPMKLNNRQQNVSVLIPAEREKNKCSLEDRKGSKLKGIFATFLKKSSFSYILVKMR
jgi:hypothetical protein